MDERIFLGKHSGGQFAIVGMGLNRLIFGVPDYQRAHSSDPYSRLVGALGNLSTGCRFSLRYVVPEPGQLRVVLLVRLDGSDESDLQATAGHALQTLQSYLQVNFKAHELEPLAGAEAFRRVLAPFDPQEVVEVTRRAAWLTVANWDVTHETPRPMGFLKDSDAGPPSEGTLLNAETKVESSPVSDPGEIDDLASGLISGSTREISRQPLEQGEPERLFYVFPFLPSPYEMREFCESLVLQRDPCLVDISFTPFSREPDRGLTLASLERSMKLCEEYLGGSREREQGTVLSLRASILRNWFFTQKHLLEEPGNSFVVRVRVASPERVDSGLVTALGNCLTGPIVASANAPPYLAGGFETISYSPTDAGRKALQELEEESIVEEPLRYCFDVESAGNMIRLPEADNESFPGVPVHSARFLEAPQVLPREGTLLGNAQSLGQVVPVRVAQDDQLRHIYAVGQTGVGKTSLVLTMAMEHIRQGQGVGVLDPHGDLIEQILARIPEERMQDVVLFDPGDVEYPLGLNLLEWETEDQKGFLVDEMLSMLRLIYPEETMGPVFDHNTRFALLLLMANKDDPGTLVEFPHLFSDPKFHKRWLPYVNDPVTRRFWEQEFPESNYSRDSLIHYIVSKFDPFITHPLVRNIIGQKRNSIHFDDVINGGKIFLANLAKGKLGDHNSALLGMIIMAKLYTAAMRRVELPMGQRRDFFLYVDEFQSLATDTFAHILSEARKFKLSLTLCNQYIAQLPGGIINAILGNVGTFVVFRVGLQDADVLKPYFESVLPGHALTNQPNFHSYARLLVNGVLSSPFSMRTIPEPSLGEVEGHQRRKMVLEESRKRYGRTRSEVEQEIAKSLGVEPG